jgi:hypothetical protein
MLETDDEAADARGHHTRFSRVKKSKEQIIAPANKPNPPQAKTEHSG